MTAASPSSSPLIVDGWSLYGHPVFLDQLESLIEEVERRRTREPEGYKKKNCTKRLAAIVKLATEVIPSNPADANFRQGDTLGSDRKHWFRAKFFQQYRLFFRFDSTSKIIVFAWVNDEKTLRAYGSKKDAYLVFSGMLDDGNPPDDFSELVRASEGASKRFAAVMKADAAD